MVGSLGRQRGAHRAADADGLVADARHGYRRRAKPVFGSGATDALAGRQ